MNSLLFDTLDNAHSSYSFRAFSLLSFFFLLCPFLLLLSISVLSLTWRSAGKDSAKTRPIPSLSQSPFSVTSLA